MSYGRHGTTIRMKRCGVDSTLHGYIFSDRSHARQWLSAFIDDADSFRLEEVEVGPLMKCGACGIVHRQSVKVVRQVTFAEALNV